MRSTLLTENAGQPTFAVILQTDGAALAGHLAEGHVRLTLKVILTEPPARIMKAHDPESGIALIRPDGSRENNLVP